MWLLRLPDVHVPPRRSSTGQSEELNNLPRAERTHRHLGPAIVWVNFGSIKAAALIWFGWLPQDTSLVLLSLAMLTALSALLLWKPLRKLQKNRDPFAGRQRFF